MDCFYVPGQTHIIDTIDPTTGLSASFSESLEQIQQRYPNAEVWEWEKAFEEIQRITYETSITAPKEITEERFHEMLNILTPMKWRSGGGAESFMVCEALSLDLHSIFCRIGSQYFEMTNRRSLTHDQIVQLCLPLIKEN